MRIALVSPYSLSVAGGVQGQVIGLCGALNRLGHPTTVIAPGKVPPGTPGSSVGRAVRIPVNGSIAPMAPHPAAAIRAVRAVRRRAFDVVHLHEPLAPSITLALLLSAAHPVVGTFHAAGERTPYRWFGRSLRHVARRIDISVAVSPTARQLASRHLGGCDELLGNGIDIEPFQATLRRPHGRSVLFLGRDEPRKGLDVLLSACALLPADVTVRIAGQGTDLARRRLVREPACRVEWLGAVSEADKVQLLRRASVLCAPSLYGESAGMVLLEAMAASTPVVASRLPGYQDLANDGRAEPAALVVAPDDPAALAAALRSVLDDDRLADRLRRRGDQRARRFSMDRLALQYVEIYRRAVALHAQRSGPTRGLRRRWTRSC